jgi:hypothetical protein
MLLVFHCWWGSSTACLGRHHVSHCSVVASCHRPVESMNPRAAKQALEMFCSAVRTTLNACQGYECQEKDGIFMLAFADAGGCGWVRGGGGCARGNREA